MIRIGRKAGAGAVLFAAAVAWATGARSDGAPAKEGDPLLVGTKWKGKLTQKGTINGSDTPLEFETVLVVTKRDGDKFEADLREESGTLKLTYLVRGEITKAKDGKGYAFEFKSYDVKDNNSTPFLGIPYTGTLSGKTLKGTWKYEPPDEDIKLAGELTLELTK